MVDTRKIFSSGKSSYLITLPKDWVIQNGLKSGDSVLIEVGSDRISIFPHKAEKKRKEAVIDYKGAEMESLIRRIISYYLAGYDSMRVKIYNNDQRNAISIASEILIGVEILEDLGNEMQIEVFLDLNRFKPLDMIEKISRICESMVSDFCKAFEEFDKYVCSTIIARENETDKLHFLVLRLLRLSSEYPDIEDLLELKGRAMEYRTVVRALERIADHAASIAESVLLLQKPLPDLCEVADFTREMLKTSFVSLYRIDSELAEEVITNSKVFIESEKSYYNMMLNRELREAMLIKSIIDSHFRILGYATDIAEVAINLSV
jgi:phosphate uptake regulator